MAASKEQITYWLQAKANGGFTHMLVVCDTFDHVDYPVYVAVGENVHAYIDKYSLNMQRVMEVYNYNRDLMKQLNSRKAWEI